MDKLVHFSSTSITCNPSPTSPRKIAHIAPGEKRRKHFSATVAPKPSKGALKLARLYTGKHDSFRCKPAFMAEAGAR